jgi:hypothetical protein
MTGNTKYLLAAIRCADALVKNYKPGDAKISPWPYRCFAKDGSLHSGKGDGMFPYSANVVEPIMLFDELVRLKQGDVAAYTRIRAGAWDWLMKYPMQNNQWVGYFEDVKASMEDKNQVIPLEFARYVLLHPEKDPKWREHAAKLIDWVKTTPNWPKYLVHGATVTTEQGSNLKDFCCNLPNQCCDSHSARLAAVEALYYAKTGDTAYKEAAYRTYNWVTYFQGLPGAAHAPFSNQWWFTDEFADGPRRMMDAFWAIPEWAPADESHLLGSSSPVTKISYGRGSVTYSTFDSDSTDVLRLNFVPDSVTSGGRSLPQHKNLLSTSGYDFDQQTHVLRIRHVASRDIDIQGKSDIYPPRFVTFDDPHRAAGTPLSGEYPSGLFDWTAGQWQIAAPGGKFGTFSLAPEKTAQKPGFTFVYPKIFVGIDINNDGPDPITLTIRSPEPEQQISVTLQPGELRRVRTGWLKPTREVQFELQNASHLRFDNLAYAVP